MGKKQTILKFIGLGLFLFLPSGLIAQTDFGGSATLKTFQVLIDRDADNTTGFEATLNDGLSVAIGVELRLNITVQTGSSPQVVLVEAQQLVGDDTFASPYFSDAGGWPVGTNNGTSGGDVIEAYMPLDRLGITQQSNFYIQSGDPAAEFDLMGPAGFTFGVPIPTLTQWMLILYVGIFLLAALWFLRSRRRKHSGGLLVLLAGLFFVASGTTILLDGQIGDWTTPAQATDPVNDTGEDAIDLLAFFVCYNNQNLFLRLDVEELENQGPLADDQAVTLLEDGSLLISLTATDLNGDPITFSIGTGPADGTLSAVTSTGPASADVTYTPNADFFGADAFTFLAEDGLGGIGTGTISITVTPVNDVPSFTAGTPISVSKDTGPQTFANWAIGVSAGPTNEASQVLTFQVTVTGNPGVFAVPPAISANGTLTFTPDADNNGAATLEITLMDDGGTANGGIDTSPVQMATITIGPVNDPPSFTAGANQTHNEDDGAMTVNAGATAMSPGPPDEAGQMLTFNATVTSDPGSIFAVAPAIDATSGDLTYTLAADAFGVATVSVTLMDDGGTANGGSDTSPPHLLTITVNEVNDAPSFANTGNVNVFKGGSTEVVSAWASMLSTGPANESGQSFLAFNVTVTSDPNGVLGTIPTINTTTGDLSFDTTADNNGTATLSITLQDDGGTANGGVDTSAAAVIDIIVGAVNDAPSFTAGMDQTHNEDDGAITVNAWATAMSPGPPDEAGQMLTFNAAVTSDPGSIFAVAPAIDATTGDLTYTLAADAFGVATVSVTLMDDGGTANGGSDTSPPQLLTITVNEVNDAPSFANTGNVNVFKGGSTEVVSAWASMLSTGPANESGQSFLAFNVTVTNDPNGVLGTIPTINTTTGDLSFDTTADNNGTATLSITLQDDGGTANGGVDTSAAAVIDIIVGAVNDAPSFTAGMDQTHNEDDGAITVNAWATAISPGPPDEAGQMLTFNAAVTSDPGNIFAVAPAIDATTGDLTYTLAADAFGVATVSVTLMDDGGIANGGNDTSPPHLLTITVNEVNDAPSFANTGDITVASGGATETTPAWASMLSLGPANESSQSFTGFNVSVVSDPNSVLGTLPSVDVGTGDLSFDTNMNDGVAMISVTLMDDGGTANGGVDTSAAAMISITVNPPNSPPVANDDTFHAGVHTRFEVGVISGAPAHRVFGSVLTSGTPDSDPDMGTTLVVTGTSNLTPGAVLNMNANGSFTLVPPPNMTTGVVTFDYTISDQHPTLPLTDTATVTVNLYDPVWYVKNDHGGPSEGTSENPFQTLAEAEAASSDGHKIFVFRGDNTVTGHNAGITLKNGQSLIGERSALVLNINGINSTIVLGTGMMNSAPLIGNAMGDVITLGDDNIVRGLIILPTASAGIIGIGDEIPMKTQPSTRTDRWAKYRTSKREGKRVGGTTLVEEVLISPAGASDGLCLLGQSGNFTFINSVVMGMAGNTGAGVVIDTCDATFTLQSLTISNVGTGIFMGGNTSPAPIGFESTSVSACSQSALDIGFEDNNISFDALSSITQNSAGNAIEFFGGSPITFSFNGPINVSNMTDSMQNAIDIDGVNGNPIFNFGDTTLNASAGNHAVRVRRLGGTSDVNFNGILNISGAGMHGLAIEDVNGTFDVSANGSTIANATASGIDISGGAAVYSFNASVNFNGTSVSMANVTGGSSQFLQPMAQNAQTRGFSATSCAGTHTVTAATFGASMSRLANIGIDIVNSTGTFNFQSFQIFTAGTGINITGGTPTVSLMPPMGSGIVDAMSTGLNHTGGTLTGTINSLISNNTTTPGIVMTSAGGGNLTIGAMDVVTTTGNGVQINGYTVAFPALGLHTVTTAQGFGLEIQNTTYSGQIDTVQVSAGLAGGVILSGCNGSLYFGRVALNTTGGIGFFGFNAGTLSVADPSSFITSVNETALQLSTIIISPNNMEFATISATNPAGGNDGLDLNFVSGGTLTIDNLTANTTVTGGNGVDIQTTSATVIINNGNIDTTTNTAVVVGTSAGGSFTFNNFDIDSTSGNGLDASGGGVIQMADTNRVDTTTGVGVILNGITIAPAGVTFASINTNGASNGIVLSNTGTMGAFTVTGNGTNNSGGILQNLTQNGILLSTTGAVNLNHMAVTNVTLSYINATTVGGLTLNGVDFQNSGSHGILGNGITGLTMTNCSLDQSGNAANEHGLRIVNLLGTSSITSTDFTRSATIHAFIQNTSASVPAPGVPADIITIDDCSFSMPVVGTFGDNVSVEAGAGANMRLILDDAVGINTFAGGQDGVQAVTATGGTLDVIIDNIDVQTTTGTGVNIGGFNASSLTFDVRNIATLNTGSIGINTTSIGGANMSGVIDNNVINGSTAGQGIQVITEGNGNITATVSNNDIDNINQEHGIRVQARAGTGTINITINNNDINNAAAPFPLEGINVESGSSAGGDTNTICLNMFSNTSVANGQEGYRLRQRIGTTFNLQDFVGNGTVAGDITSWINTTKSNTGTTQILIGSSFTASAGACPIP